MLTIHVDENIRMKQLALLDGESLFALTEKNREHLQTWMDWVNEITTVSAMRSFVRVTLSNAEHGERFAFGIWRYDQLIGLANINVSHGSGYENGIGSVGYWLDKDFQGYGIVTRCVKTLVNFGFERFCLQCVEVRAGIDNVRSLAVPQRLGFKFKGVLCKAGQVNDLVADVAVYSVQRCEWKPCS